MLFLLPRFSLLYIVLRYGNERTQVPLICTLTYSFHVLYSICGLSLFDSCMLIFLLFELLLRLIFLGLLAGL